MLIEWADRFPSCFPRATHPADGDRCGGSARGSDDEPSASRRSGGPAHVALLRKLSAETTVASPTQAQPRKPELAKPRVPDDPPARFSPSRPRATYAAALLRDGRLQVDAFRHQMRLSERLLAHVEMLLDECTARWTRWSDSGWGSVRAVYRHAHRGDDCEDLCRSAALVAVDGLEALAAEYAGPTR